MSARSARIALLAGALLAALGAVGVATSDEPELSLSSLDPWLVVYALGLLVALGALPFVLHERMAARTDDRDRRWELAVAAWGGIALIASAAFLVLGLALGFDPDTAEGALAIVGLAASGLVVAGVGATMLAG